LRFAISGGGYGAGKLGDLSFAPLLAALGMAIFAAPADAGFCSAATGDPRHEFEFFAGYSPASSTLIGTESRRRFVAAGFSYEYRCWVWNSMSLSYTGTIMPAAVLLQPAEVLYNFTPPYQRQSPAHAVYGFAVAPLGFTLDVFRRRRLHPYVETVEGLIASTEPIPENQPDASGLNFLFDIGVGVRWNVRAHGAVEFGYRFLHISNADTTSFNPGVDNNVFYLGYSFLR
jgi:opacity protein-like surface antigen